MVPDAFDWNGQCTARGDRFRCTERYAWAAARRHGAANVQAIIEDHFQVQLKTPLLAERFVKAATGLVIILGLLGTFYGLTLSIGRIVHLVASDAGGTADMAGTVTTGLTHALSGMAVAFSNSLVGIISAVIPTVLGVLSNLTDRRVGLMLQLEASTKFRRIAGHKDTPSLVLALRAHETIESRQRARDLHQTELA